MNSLFGLQVTVNYLPLMRILDPRYHCSFVRITLAGPTCDGPRNYPRMPVSLVSSHSLVISLVSEVPMYRRTLLEKHATLLLFQCSVGRNVIEEFIGGVFENEDDFGGSRDDFVSAIKIRSMYDWK